MAEVVQTLTSANRRLRIEVVRRPTGGFQLVYSHYRRESVSDFNWAWEGWVSVPGRVILTDTPEQGAILAAEELALWEREENEREAAPNKPGT